MLFLSLSSLSDLSLSLARSYLIAVRPCGVAVLLVQHKHVDDSNSVLPTGMLAMQMLLLIHLKQGHLECPVLTETVIEGCKMTERQQQPSVFVVPECGNKSETAKHYRQQQF